MLPMRLGFGISNSSLTQTTTCSSGSCEIVDSISFLDVSYLFGETFTFQLAYGNPYASADIAYGTSTLHSKGVSGSAIGLSFDYDFGGFEATFVYSNQSIKQKYEWASGGMTFEGETTHNRAVMSVGVGFIF